MSEWVLEMKGIFKGFPGTQALSNVDFELKPGEIHALIGENGAGKSTLMNILVGIHRMDAGEIFVRGEKTENHHPYEALGKGIGIVPQEINLVPEVSVAENIFLGKERRKSKHSLISWDKTREEAIILLEKLDVKINVDQKLGRLSAAYQQLVSIARLLASGSEILIMDEPTAALTASEVESLFKSMRRLRDDGKSIIFITHHLSEVKDICDRVTIMRDGNVVNKSHVKDISIDEMIYYMANRKITKTQKAFNDIKTDTYFEVVDFNRENEFNGISFSVKKGEIFGIAGLVGSGRTELVKCIFGITKKQTGRTYIDGKEINIHNTAVAIKNGIGFVPEERRREGIFPVMSVMENMMMPSFEKMTKVGLLKFSEMSTKCLEFIEKLKVKTPNKEILIKNLSGGNQQKVIIARWLAKGIDMLILDEPTRGIDVNAKGEIHRLIKDMAGNGVTVIVISSELEEVIELSDRIMVMHEGRIKGFLDDLQGLQQEEILKVALQ